MGLKWGLCRVKARLTLAIVCDWDTIGDDGLVDPPVCDGGVGFIKRVCGVLCKLKARLTLAIRG